MASKLISCGGSTLMVVEPDGSVWRYDFQTEYGTYYRSNQFGYADMRWQWVKLSGPSAKTIAEVLADVEASTAQKAEVPSI